MNKIVPLISADEALQLKSAVLVDSRSGKDAFERYMNSHLKGALFVNLEYDLSKKTSDPAYGGRHPLPDIKTFANFLGKIGIQPSSHVLVYDDKGGANPAARFWWMMRAIGHKQIQVIDGGLDALTKRGTELSKELTQPKVVEPYPVTKWLMPTVDIDFVSKIITNSNYLIVDVREAYRYRGESEPIDLVAGHIPNAINVPYLENLSSQGYFIPANELIKKYEGILQQKKPEQVIVHCGSGVTACHTLLAMEQAGIYGAKLYIGSWGEWSRRK